MFLFIQRFLVLAYNDTFYLSKVFSCSSCNLIVYRKDPHISSFPLPSSAWDKYAIKDAGWVK